MNKNFKLLFLLIALVVLVVLTFYLTKDESTLISDEALTDFAVEDTAGVNMLVMSNTADQSITIERKGEKWIEKDGMEIDQKMVHNILKTIKRIQVKSPVPENSHETVINQIIGNHVKMKIFLNGKEFKTYYVGHPTSDHYGTYMILETPEEGRSPEPFITYLPGHDGHLGTRFIADPDAWRFSGIFNLDPLKIQEVSVTNNQNPQESFVIQSMGENQFKLLNEFDKSIFQFDTVLVRDYLTRYRKVHYDFVENNLTEAMEDSILSSQPFRTIDVVLKDGTSKLVECFRRPPRKQENDMDGNPITYDRDLFIGRINKKDLVVCQYYVFDKLFLSQGDFLKTGNIYE